MALINRCVVALPPAEVFARLRHYERAYPDHHPAHDPLPAGYTPSPLAVGYRFGVSERFGLEHRRYHFLVVQCDPAQITLSGQSTTTIGLIRFQGLLEVEFRLAAVGADETELTLIQRVSLGHPWIDQLLRDAWFWEAVRRHADEEFATGVAVMTAPGFSAG